MTAPLPIVHGMKCHCLCGFLHPGRRGLCTDRYETSRPMPGLTEGRPLQMCTPCARAHDRRTADADPAVCTHPDSALTTRRASTLGRAQIQTCTRCGDTQAMEP